MMSEKIFVKSTTTQKLVKGADFEGEMTKFAQEA